MGLEHNVHSTFKCPGVERTFGRNSQDSRGVQCYRVFGINDLERFLKHLNTVRCSNASILTKYVGKYQMEEKLALAPLGHVEPFYS